MEVVIVKFLEEKLQSYSIQGRPSPSVLMGSFYLSITVIQNRLIVAGFTKEVYRVRTGPGKPGKSWNFTVAFSRTGKFWKRATGPGKCWKSVKRK